MSSKHQRKIDCAGLAQVVLEKVFLGLMPPSDPAFCPSIFVYYVAPSRSVRWFMEFFDMKDAINLNAVWS